MSKCRAALIEVRDAAIVVLSTSSIGKVVCSGAAHADLNAAINHRDPLPEITRAEVQDLNRTTGFYWLPSGMTRVDFGEELIVPLGKEIDQLYKNVSDL
jgi:hypothetical protein